MSRPARPQRFPVTRRAALQVGVGMFGLNLVDFAARSQAQAATKRPTKDVSCIFLFLAGGASHFETFDPKPDASTGIRGEWAPISTSVPGTQIIEKLPLTARLAHRYALVRSWQGVDGRHDGGSQHVLNGFPTGPVSSTSQQHYPNMGCLISALYGAKVPGVPSHVGLPVAGRYTQPVGYLGPAHAAFDVKEDPSQPDFRIAEKSAVGAERLGVRHGLLNRLDQAGPMHAVGSTPVSVHEAVHEEAFATLASGRIAQAADLSGESAALRESYGMNVYGQRVLLARRMIEAGARFVTINQAVQPAKSPNGTGGTWDTHGDQFRAMMDADGRPGNLPQLDQSLSALLEDLHDRGMLDSTLVVVMGEFGRTPRINANAGRDHYPRAGSVLLAGAGIRGGAVVGATDRNGTEPITVPLTPADFAATIYHALGIDPHATYFPRFPRFPRPTPIADGQVIRELFA